VWLRKKIQEMLRGGFDAETKLLAKGRQLDAPARSDEQWSAHFLLQGSYRFGDGGLGERESLRRFSEMEILRDRQETVDLPQFHACPRVNRLIGWAD
jgi:hypothetical protein